jgi:hypothetical protein
MSGTWSKQFGVFSNNSSLSPSDGGSESNDSRFGPEFIVQNIALQRVSFSHRSVFIATRLTPVWYLGLTKFKVH